ncbi:MAG: hypothetical protein ABIN58_09835, partial [candidate division WOR-3 bacterium]
MGKLAYVIVALMVLVVITGCGKTRNKTAEKPEARTPRTAEAAPAVTEKPAAKLEPVVPKVSPAETAISAAAKQNRYAFVTFYRKDDE